MDLYGRPLIEAEDDENDPLLLREVTIAADPETLRNVARFLERTAARIEEDGAYFEPDWHMPYQDFARDESDEDFSGGDVIAMQPLHPREDSR